MRLLSRAQLDAWATFGREWEPFKAAWIERGLLWPPMGSIDDEGDAQTQRAMLWQVLDARPNDLVRWTREAPGRRSHAVVGYVTRRFNAIRAEVGAAEDQRVTAEYWARRQEKGRAPERLRDILSRASE